VQLAALVEYLVVAVATFGAMEAQIDNGRADMQVADDDLQQRPR
jgi:hypothetical protein